jgi:hypothetical protein
MENNSIRIKRPKDIERLSQRVINSILKSGEEAKNAGKLCNLGMLWLKAFETRKLEERAESAHRLACSKASRRLSMSANFSSSKAFIQQPMS